MSEVYDLIVRGGMILDGSGREPFVGDIAVVGDKIVEVGSVTKPALEEIDASGLLVTPGFVDIHTHYDGQAIWEGRMEPSSSHGVTTVVTGNCGVGFAPCRPADRERLIALMEGVEDIPEVVLTEGLPWTWETFPEYLEAVAAVPHDVDLAAMLPHAALRVYVMGERAADRQQATPDDLAAMARLTEQAMAAGAIGFGTSRSIAHKDSRGQPTPTKSAAEEELLVIASAMRDAGHGVIEAVFDFGNLDNEFAMLRRVAERSGRPVSFTLAQTLEYPRAWERALPMLKEANDNGIKMRGQVIARPTGLLLGFGLSYNPFSLRPTYIALEHLPDTNKLSELRKPGVRARILAEADGPAKYHALVFLNWFDRMFILGDPPNYRPPLDQSIAALAAQAGMAPEAYAYSAMLEDDGQAILFIAVGNYADGTLEPVARMLSDDNTVLGLGDGGAHYGMICDAGYPTFVLSFWGRDVSSDLRLPLPQLVKMLTSDPAAAVDLKDRGLIGVGYKADLNIIDFGALRVHAPRPVFDLPGNGRRLKQRADGFVATIVSGQVTRRHGEATGALPGRLIRGPQSTATEWN